MPKEVKNEVKKVNTKENISKKGKATENKKAVIKNKKTKKVETVNNKKVAQKLTKNVTSKKDNKNVTKLEKKINDSVKQPEFLQEYYDLPYRYNETIVTILAQTPKRLFVYWDISDKDREAYKKAFGDDFFEKTYPVLLVHNEDLNYTFEVPINDFANSWYLDIQDSKTNYVVQLGRKFRNLEQAKQADFKVVKDEHININNDFIYITDSNKLEIPNDHILFELLPSKIKYRNVKNGNEFDKELKQVVNDFDNSYPSNTVHELYNKLYEDEIAKEDFGRKNPGSEEFGLPTSSGAFKF